MPSKFLYGLMGKYAGSDKDFIGYNIHCMVKEWVAKFQSLRTVITVTMLLIMVALATTAVKTVWIKGFDGYTVGVFSLFQVLAYLMFWDYTKWKDRGKGNYYNGLIDPNDPKQPAEPNEPNNATVGQNAVNRGIELVDKAKEILNH